MEVEEERRRGEGDRGGLNLFYVWTYCAIYQWPDLSNVCLDRSVQYNIGHIWPIGQISPMEAMNYNFPHIVHEMCKGAYKIGRQFARTLFERLEHHPRTHPYKTTHGEI